jgi:circadian clock protein KaiC
MFRGNLLRGTSMLLLGTSGTGKSLLTTQFAVASAERGEPVAMYLFDERLETVLQRAAGTGLPLARWIENGTIEVRRVDPTELTAGEFSHIARRQVMERGIRMLIIDSLNGYAYAMPDEQSLMLHLHELLSFLSQQSVTPVCTMIQHGLMAPGEQTFDVSYIADAVLLLRHFEFAGGMHKAISLYKLRTGDHAKSIHELLVGADGLRLGPELRQFQGILSGTPEFVGAALDGYEDADRVAGDRDRD